MGKIGCPLHGAGEIPRHLEQRNQVDILAPQPVEQRARIALAQLWHVFNMRGTAAGGFRLRNEITTNPWVWGALALCLALVLAAVYQPTLAEVLQLAHPGARGWMLILAMSLLPLALAPLSSIGKLVYRDGNQSRSAT